MQLSQSISVLFSEKWNQNVNNFCVCQIDEWKMVENFHLSVSLIDSSICQSDRLECVRILQLCVE